ncbi:hypothetical protein L218DRAFT_991088 [Marasmius fiardii PR-910]|nr:hypothetical protein L218DRAFT_991088 [Marasmius fiardii PR-910]
MLTQAVTIQRFPLKTIPGQTDADTVQKLTEAMSKFKTSNRNEVEHSYLGIVSGNPEIAEQIFLWRCLDDSSLDITKPFIQFSSTGTFNRSTVLMNDRATLLNALNAPITETVLVDVRPEISTSDVDRDVSTVAADGRNRGFGVGGVHAFQIVGETRTLVVVNGWKSEQAVYDWIASQDAEIAAVFERLMQSAVGGVVTPLFKHVVEVA